MELERRVYDLALLEKSVDFFQQRLLFYIYVFLETLIAVCVCLCWMFVCPVCIWVCLYILMSA